MRPFHSDQQMQLLYTGDAGSGRGEPHMSLYMAMFFLVLAALEALVLGLNWHA